MQISSRAPAPSPIEVERTSEPFRGPTFDSTLSVSERNEAVLLSGSFAIVKFPANIRVCVHPQARVPAR